ncbi:hypothetical protein LY12_002982 [Prauserella alba]|uniref:Alpha/beta hydrolase family protein n=1 Tax=Prauserella alba TaxID=176898 RepID=A0ABP4FWB2_9PSEU|nr:hypothetical protein [Prauserella alba]
MVAHSLGCITVLRHLASLTAPWHLGTLVLVSGFVDPLPTLPDLDSFIGDGVGPAGIREHVGSLTLLQVPPRILPSQPSRPRRTRGEQLGR